MLKWCWNIFHKLICCQKSGAPTAKVGFTTDALMYKSYDFRCLKPKKGVPSEKWPHYWMPGYRKAKTKEEVAKVDEIPFDKYFMNLEDTEVLDVMTNGKKSGLDAWKRTYGFDWADWVQGMQGLCADLHKLRKHCLEEEYGSYAQNCKKGGGFFKCGGFT